MMTAETVTTYNKSANQTDINEVLGQLQWYDEEPIVPEQSPKAGSEWIYDTWSSSHAVPYQDGGAYETRDPSLELTLSQGNFEPNRISWCSLAGAKEPTVATRLVWEQIRRSPLMRLKPEFIPGSYRNPITVRAADGVDVVVVLRSTNKGSFELPKELLERLRLSLIAGSQEIQENLARTDLPSGTRPGFSIANTERALAVRPTAQPRQTEQEKAVFVRPSESSVGPISATEHAGLVHWANYFAPVYPLTESDGPAILPLHSEVEAFSKGFEGVIPDSNTLEIASFIVNSALRSSKDVDLEFDDTDGSLSFQLRSQTGFLVVAELSLEGELHANIYNDENPDPNAGIEDIWIKHLPQTSPAELVAWF